MGEKELLNEGRISILKKEVIDDNPKIPDTFYTPCSFYDKPNRKLEYINLPLINILDSIFRSILVYKYPILPLSTHGYLREDIMKNFDKIKNEDKKLIELYYQISSIIESASDCTRNRYFNIKVDDNLEKYDEMMFGCGTIDEKIYTILEKESKMIYKRIRKIDRYKHINKYPEMFSKTIIFKVYEYISDLISSLSSIIEKNGELVFNNDNIDGGQIKYFYIEFSLLSLYLIKTQYRNIMYKMINKYCFDYDIISIENLLNFVFPEVIDDFKLFYCMDKMNSQFSGKYGILHNFLDITYANFYNEYTDNIQRF